MNALMLSLPLILSIAPAHAAGPRTAPVKVAEFSAPLRPVSAATLQLNQAVRASLALEEPPAKLGSRSVDRREKPATPFIVDEQPPRDRIPPAVADASGEDDNHDDPTGIFAVLPRGPKNPLSSMRAFIPLAPKTRQTNARGSWLDNLFDGSKTSKKRELVAVP